MLYPESYPQPLPAAGDQVFKKATHPYRRFYEDFYRKDLTYLAGYRAAADILFEHAEQSIAKAPNDPLDVANWLVYPIYFLYRHAIELSLKQMRAAKTEDGQTTTPDRGKVLRNDHSLLELWMEVKDWVQQIGGERLGAETDAFEKLIEQIHQVDPKGDAGRYDLHRNQSETFKGVRPIDLPNLRGTMNAMLNFLTWIWEIYIGKVASRNPMQK
jgi:hypothetical protein